MTQEEMVQKIEELTEEIHELKKNNKEKLIDNTVNIIIYKLHTFSNKFGGTLSFNAGNIIDGMYNIIDKEIYKLLKELKKGKMM